MIVITGGIGCGKSTVLKQFSAFGRQVADADDLTHALYVPGSPLLAELAREFGAGILTSDGALDRATLAQIVFAQPDALAKLEALIHPRVFNRLRELDEDAYGKLVAAIPLWYECGGAEKFPGVPPKVVSVWCNDAIQWERLRARGWSDEHITQRLDAQFNKDTKLRYADFGIINNGTLQELTEQCRRINAAL